MSKEYITMVISVIIIVVASVFLGIFIDRLLNCHSKTYLTSDRITEWIKQDKTNTLKYTDNFKCLEFSNTFVSNAAKEGIDAYTTILHYGTEPAHAIVAIRDNDKFIFVSPQTDNTLGYITTERKALTSIELKRDTNQ